MARGVRIANASGFYGDRFAALTEQVEGGAIDVLSGDWLAELTMLLLARDRQRDSTLGYARTFPEQVAPVLAHCLGKRIRIVTNAGGVNPHSLAQVLEALAAEQGLKPKIAVVDGDEVTDRLDAWEADGEPVSHIVTGLPLAKDPRTRLGAWVYLGCAGIVRALQKGADIVITGRVTDAALVMGPAAWYHGWRPHQYEQLASALVAGHVLECGTQATGGNHPFFGDVAAGAPGFPIAEIHKDGTFFVTKHPGTPGRVDRHTVTAQLLYEIEAADVPTPDVVARFDSLSVLDAGPDRVRVSGATGLPPTGTLKVGVALDAGWRNRVHLLVGGNQTDEKCHQLAEQFWSLVGGRDSFDDTRTEIIGAPGGDTPVGGARVLTLAARSQDADRMGRAFSNRALELVLGSVPGVTLLRPPGRGSRCATWWPALVDRKRVVARVHFAGELEEIDHPEPSAGHPLFDVDGLGDESTLSFQPLATGVTRPVLLADLVGARSGDKGGNATLGIWVRNPDHFGWLTETLDSRRLLSWLAPTGYDGPVQRFVLPNLSAILFVLQGYLGEGAGTCLSSDPQAKLLAEFVRSRVLEVDTSIATST